MRLIQSAQTRALSVLAGLIMAEGQEGVSE